MDNWQVILTSILGSGGLSGIIVFLLMEWIRKSIEHEYNEKEIRLKAELDGNLEGAKAGYKKVLDENQIKFSRLYSDQAEAAKRLYRFIHQTHSRLTVLVSSLQMAPEDPDERNAHFEKMHQDAYDAFNDCNTCFQENRILLPEDICAEMDGFLSIDRGAYFDFNRRERRPEKWDEAEDAMRGPVFSLKRKLEARFRQLLGVLPAELEDSQSVEPAAQKPEKARE